MTNNKKSSRNIPLPIQREVRKRCGFGCVMCGNPIYDYEHMKEWAKVKEHIAKDITLLCPSHHRDKTVGLLPKERVIEANRNPFNIKNGKSSSHELYYNGHMSEFVMGENSFIYQFNFNYEMFIPLMVHGVPIVSFMYENGRLLLNLTLYNHSNNPILIIKRNHLEYSIDIWDITFKAKTLTFRDAKGSILFELIFEAPNKVIINKGNIYYDGVSIKVTPDKFIVNSNSVSSGRVSQFLVGLSIGENPLSTGIVFGG